VEEVKVSRSSAKKAIEIINNGVKEFKKIGHGRSSVGSLMSLIPEEELFFF